MEYKIEVTKTAQKEILKLETIVQRRIGKKLLSLTEAEELLPLAKALSGNLKGLYRVRIGDYRILFEIKGDTITIISVRHRKDAYK